MQSVTPTPVHSSRLREENWYKPDFGPLMYNSFFSPLVAFTGTDMERAEVIIDGLRSRAVANPQNYKHRQIIRAEFVYDKVSHGHQGAILFSMQHAELYCRDAHLGYNGSGPALTETIFKILGAGALFEEINSLVANRAYHIVLTREQTVVIDDIETAVPFSEPLDAWRWWEIPV